MLQDKLEELRALFKGKRVLIVHHENDLETIRGKCTGILSSKGKDRGYRYTLVLAGGRGLDFNPATVRKDSVIGPLPGSLGGRREIILLDFA